MMPLEWLELESKGQLQCKVSVSVDPRLCKECVITSLQYIKTMEYF